MTNTSNKLSANQIANRLDEIFAERNAWENGLYKQSNDKLYAILEKCFNIFKEMKGERKLIAELNALLEDRKITFTEKTALATKVVRFVFNANDKNAGGNRVFGYARVLTVAAAEKTEKESFAAFIKRKGGIEEVRKQAADGTLTKADQEKQRKADAEKYFPVAPALTANFKSNDANLHPHSEATNAFAAALVRKNDDGTLSIVFACNKKSVVNLLLAEGGKLAGTELGKKNSETKRRANNKNRATALSKLAA